MSHKLTTRNNKERNEAALLEAMWQSEGEKAAIAEMQKTFGVDPRDAEKFPVMKGGFFKEAQKKLREADSVTAFPGVLRAGVQSIVNSIYASVETTFGDWAHTVTSTKLEELYAPIQGIGFPSQIGENEVYPEVGAAGLDLKLRNRKFGTLFSVSKELMELDQTGQFQQQAGLLGEYAKQILEVYCYGKLASVSGMKYANMTIPTCETKPSTEATYPWSTSLVGGGATKPAAYGALNQGNIQAGIVALMNQLNILGLKMSVNPSRLLISPHYRFDAAVLLNSGWYPTGATAGSTGSVGAINPLKGILDLTTSRFMFDQNGSVNADSKAWYIVDDTKPFFVCQVNVPAEVQLENPASGQSFDRDTVRFKLRVMANADFIDSRFAWQGSNGSV